MNALLAHVRTVVHVSMVLTLTFAIAFQDTQEIVVKQVTKMSFLSCSIYRLSIFMFIHKLNIFIRFSSL